MKNSQRLLPLILCASFITSCEQIEEFINPPEEAITPTLPNISSTSLKQFVSNSEFEIFLKNGLRLDNSFDNGYIYALPAFTNNSTIDISTTSTTETSTYSTTNTQEAGVDEADRIEYDGEFLYILTESNNYYISNSITTSASLLPPDTSTTTSAPLIIAPEPVFSGVRVMQHGASASMSEIAWLEFSNRTYYTSARGLYHNQNVLVSLSSGYEPIPQTLDQASIWYGNKPTTILELMDVTVPSEINLSHSIEIDGYLQSSRRIGNKLILVTEYSPTLTGYIPYPYTEEQVSVNEVIINSATFDDLIPKITINNQTLPLLTAANCYIPQDSLEGAGYAKLTIIITIDLTTPESFKSTCFNSVTHGTYVSGKSLYITASGSDDKTAIHKFSIDGEQAQYQASGSIPGNLGWNNPAYRMSESANTIRTVSTTHDSNWQPEHFLTILEDDSSGHLNQISQLPNNEQTQAIGKPNEDIRAVRYFQDRAFIVTFFQVDPLYVIDLSNATAPAIIGELEIPGFSTYLHPVNENLILGFGFENWADTKMSLFDISNPVTPVEIKNFVFPSSSTPLNWDTHALAFVETSANHYRFSFPITHWENYNYNSSLLMFDLVVDNELTTLNTPLQLAVVNDSKTYHYGYTQRSVIQGNEVHYIYDHRVWSASWDLSIINPAQ